MLCMHHWFAKGVAVSVLKIDLRVKTASRQRIGINLWNNWLSSYFILGIFCGRFKEQIDRCRSVKGEKLEGLFCWKHVLFLELGNFLSEMPKGCKINSKRTMSEQVITRIEGYKSHHNSSLLLSIKCIYAYIYWHTHSKKFHCECWISIRIEFYFLFWHFTGWNAFLHSILRPVCAPRLNIKWICASVCLCFQ